MERLQVQTPCLEGARRLMILGYHWNNNTPTYVAFISCYASSLHVFYRLVIIFLRLDPLDFLHFMVFVLDVPQRAFD